MSDQTNDDEHSSRQILSFRWYDPDRAARDGDLDTADIELRVLIDLDYPTIKDQIRHGLHMAVEEMYTALDQADWHYPEAQTDQLSTGSIPVWGTRDPD